VVEADVRAAALAEALFGAGRASRCFLYVTVGTGISSSLVVDGKPFTGAHGAAGTMASGPLSFTCPGCGRQDRRSLEEIASGPALVARYNALGGAAERGEDLLAAEKRGEAAASEVLRSGGQAMGMGIGWLVNVLDPERVVVGGGLGLGGGTYWDAFVASARLHIWSDDQRGVPILPAATGPDAGVIGAAAAAWRRARG
jgi:glucokinase